MATTATDTPDTKNFTPPPATPNYLTPSPGSPQRAPDPASSVDGAVRQLQAQGVIGTGTKVGAALPGAGAAGAATPAPATPAGGTAATTTQSATPTAPADGSLVTPQAVTDFLAQPNPRFDAFWAKMTPRESGGKDVPNFRYDPTHTASGPAQITDTNWKDWAPRLGIDIKRFPTAMSAKPEWQKAVTKLGWMMYGETPWDAAHGGSLPVTGQGGSQGIQYPGADSAAKINELYGTKAADLDKRVAAATAKINSMDGDIGEMRKRILAARDQADAAQDNAMKAIAKAPANPEIDGIKHASGLATIIGILGGALTKHPMLASANAAAAAIESYNAGDLNNYKIAYQNWKTQTDLLFKVADMNATRVKDIMDEEKLPLEEKRLQVDLYLRAAGLEQLADQARIEGPKAVLDWQTTMYNAVEQARTHREEMEMNNWYRLQSLDRPVPQVDKEGNPGLYYPYSRRWEPTPGMPVGKGAGATAAGDLDRAVNSQYQAWLQTDEGKNATDAQKDQKKVAIRQDLVNQGKGGPSGQAARDVNNAVETELNFWRKTPEGQKADDLQIAQKRVELRGKYATEVKGGKVADLSAVLDADVADYVAAHPGASGPDRKSV